MKKYIKSGSGIYPAPLSNRKSGAGFTIIELIVVIAIIAVLAAIVLVNVTQYISKGKDASVKGNMSSMATIAAGVYDTNSSTFFDDDTTGPHLSLALTPSWMAGVTAIETSDGQSASANVQIITSAWCIQTTLNETGKFWCADSTGYKGDTGNNSSCDATTADCAADAAP